LEEFGEAGDDEVSGCFIFFGGIGFVRVVSVTIEVRGIATSPDVAFSAFVEPYILKVGRGRRRRKGGSEEEGLEKMLI
jgi:hypothetical protein